MLKAVKGYITFNPFAAYYFMYEVFSYKLNSLPPADTNTS